MAGEIVRLPKWYVKSMSRTLDSMSMDERFEYIRDAMGIWRKEAQALGDRGSRMSKQERRARKSWWR